MQACGPSASIVLMASVTHVSFTLERMHCFVAGWFGDKKTEGAFIFRQCKESQAFYDALV